MLRGVCLYVVGAAIEYPSMLLSSRQARLLRLSAFSATEDQRFALCSRCGTGLRARPLYDSLSFNINPFINP